MKPYPFDESQGNFTEMVEEYTPAETFYDLENPTQDDNDVYIEHLERKIKAMKQSLKVLHDEAEAMPSATYFKNQLWKLYKL